MRRVARANTPGEMALRRELHRRGLRFRVQRAPIAGLRITPDILFPRARVAVFVDGCYWHGCPEHFTEPVRNRAYWVAKVDRNKQRDRAADARLTAEGWLPVRFWEHASPIEAASDLETVLHGSPR